MSVEPVPRRSLPDDRNVDDVRSVESLRTLVRSLHDAGKVPPELYAEVAELLDRWSGEAGPRLRLVGRARKVSVSMPEDLTVAVQQRVGHGEFSRYVTDAVARQLELDLLGELSELLAADHGPIGEETLAEARQSWPDA